MKPNILISGSDISRANYENAIAAAGGTFGSYYLPSLPELSSPAHAAENGQITESIRSLAASYDGLLLAGGGDIQPSLFGQENTASGTPDEARDAIEFELVRLFLQTGKPILGICRGFQVVNVALGGTLHQDVGEIGHRIHTPEAPHPPAKDITVPPSDKVHLTRVAPGSFLGMLYEPVFSVNSAHHQSIDRLAESLLAVQWALEDGCVEAAIHPSFPYIGVQWHPERMCLAKKRDDTVDGLPIFQYFLSCLFS